MIKVICESVSLLLNLDVRNFNKPYNLNKPSSSTSSEESTREVTDDDSLKLNLIRGEYSGGNC